MFDSRSSLVLQLAVVVVLCVFFFLSMAGFAAILTVHTNDTEDCRCVSLPFQTRNVARH